MKAHELNPILNVSNMAESFEWFKKLGWEVSWAWDDPPTFAGVGSGKCGIFLSLNGQGGRGKGNNTATFGPEGDRSADKGVWISIWVDDVDAEYRNCTAQGLEVMWPPTDHLWGAREMHVRHPDGHIFRISQSLGKKP